MHGTQLQSLPPSSIIVSNDSGEAHLRRAASALSDPGSGAPFSGSELPDADLAAAGCKPTLKTLLHSPATRSMTGCTAAGKKVANLNSSLGSPLHACHHNLEMEVLLSC